MLTSFCIGELTEACSCTSLSTFVLLCIAAWDRHNFDCAIFCSTADFCPHNFYILILTARWRLCLASSLWLLLHMLAVFTGLMDNNTLFLNPSKDLTSSCADRHVRLIIAHHVSDLVEGGYTMNCEHFELLWFFAARCFGCTLLFPWCELLTTDIGTQAAEIRAWSHVTTWSQFSYMICLMLISY